MLLVYFGLAVLVYMQFGAGKDPKKNRTVCIWITVFLFLISAMKSISANGDLTMYSRTFGRLGRYTYREIVNLWLNDDLKDGIFYVVAKAFGDVGLTDYIWMGFIALTFAAGVGWFVYRNSAKPFLSLMLLWRG